MKFIKKLIWLVKNQDKIEKLLKSTTKKASDDDFSVAGVPDFQREYVDDLLSGRLKK